jgi:hypothetical protein
MIATQIEIEAVASDVLTHLGRQLKSAERLLDIVLRQSDAVRRHAAGEVITGMGAIQHAMIDRSTLEDEREVLLYRIAAVLSVEPHAVTADRLAACLPGATAADLQVRSARLRGLLSEVASERRTDRALMPG